MQLKKLLALSFLLLAAAFFPGRAGAEEAGWETLADGTKAYGFWAAYGGTEFLIECDPDTGEKTGYAYVNSGKYVAEEATVLDGYDETYYIDYSQPKRYLYPPYFFPLIYRDTTLSIRRGTEDPEMVYYPYGTTLSEDWRQVIVPVYNPNEWPITAQVNLTMANGDKWSGEIYLDAGETKYVLLKIPEGAKANSGSSSFKTTYITAYGRVEENHDPYAPPKYQEDPRASDGNVVARHADFRGLSFGSPEWYDERDSQKVFILQPAFKEVMRWVPDDPGNWRVGHPEYDTVPGYRWTRVDVSVPGTIEGEPLPIPATQEDIDNLRAVGPVEGKYYKTEGATVSVCNKDKIASGRDEDGDKIDVYRYYYKARIPVINNTGFIARFDNLKLVTRQRINGDWEKVIMPGSASGGPVPPGETGELYAEFTQDNYELVNKKKNIWERQRIFSPRVIAGSVFNGIGGIYYPQILETDVTINAVAGCEDYNKERHWSREFMPSLRVTMFDFEEVMTPEELATFAQYVDPGIRDNIIHFLAGRLELMEVSAEYNRYDAIFDD